MPQGVEHREQQSINRDMREVPTSVTPKGVEHLTTLILTVAMTASAYLSDAERR